VHASKPKPVLRHPGGKSGLSGTPPTKTGPTGWALQGHLRFQRSSPKAAKDLKGPFPVLQVKVYDAEKKRSEKIELAAA
jgi:hypothetical protein